MLSIISSLKITQTIIPQLPWMENRFQFIADPAYEEAIYYIVLTLILT